MRTVIGALLGLALAVLVAYAWRQEARHDA